MELGAVANERLGHTALIARLDHSGKGGIGAALQNVVLMLRVVDRRKVAANRGPRGMPNSRLP